MFYLIFFWLEIERRVCQIKWRVERKTEQGSSECVWGKGVDSWLGYHLMNEEQDDSIDWPMLCLGLKGF